MYIEQKGRRPGVANFNLAFDSDPVVVLVLSLTFIASVFGLHIVGKFLRA